MSNENKRPAVITDLKPADCNPRIITHEALDGLKSSVAEFGDIGGIVFNVRLGCLVAGHQRVAALREKFGDGLTIQPDGFGNGRIATAAGPFGVRFVDWDEIRTRAAMLVANNPEIQGDWTDAAADMLDRLHEEAGDMFAAMKFDRLLASLPEPSNGEVRLQSIQPLAAPKMAWVLIGIPTVRFGEISEAVERIAAMPGAMVETTVSNA